MKKDVVCLGFVTFLLAAGAGIAPAQERAPMLVNSAWPVDHLHDANLVLIHVGDKKEFDGAHIPGAQFIALTDISDPKTTLRLELPSIEKLQHAFESRGISNESRIVVYPGKDSYSPSTRVIWTLTYVGLGDRCSKAACPPGARLATR